MEEGGLVQRGGHPNQSPKVVITKYQREAHTSNHHVHGSLFFPLLNT